jgi:hypothetical protein
MQSKGKKQIKPELVKTVEPIMPAATKPVENLPAETVTMMTKPSNLEGNPMPKFKFFGEGGLTNFANMTKQTFLTDLEKRKLRSRLNYACPESRDVIQTIVEILERL